MTKSAGVALLAAALTMSMTTAARAATAPGAPGANATWTSADKHGFGTSATTASHVWFTLGQGGMTEVFYPDLGTPSVRTLDLVVSDGKTFAERDSAASRRAVQPLGDLVYRQVDEEPGRFRVVKTYSTDPARDVVRVAVRLTSLSGRKLSAYAVLDPSLSNNGMDDSGTSTRHALVAGDASMGSAMVASPQFTRTSSGYLGASDGYTDLQDFHMDWTYTSAPDGNVVQTGRTQLTGLRGGRRTTLAVGFGSGPAAARSAARASLADSTAQQAYARGWARYLAGLKRPPAAANRALYETSVMTLAASEDKTYRGAYVASPTMPWAWGTGLENPSGAYHLVWARDLYQIASALLAAGDTAGARRAVDYLFDRQQKPDGSFPQNSTVDGTPHWTNLQLDEVALPIVLAWQTGQTGGALYRDHIKRAADFLVSYPGAPDTPQDRWENQGGYSPGTTAAEIAGLVCAADIARRDGDPASAARYLQTADDWQRRIQGWTATTNGPFSPRPYYLRVTKDGNPDAGTPYDIGDSGPNGVDQRAVVDPSFLELVRLGVKPASDPVIRNTIAVVDQQLRDGPFWHRYDFDGYGEKKDGSPWDVGFPANPTTDWANNTTIGRVWPIFGGERGEYDLLAGDPSDARAQLAHMGAAANDGGMLPEQVWSPDFPGGGPVGSGTLSATPLLWSHAQYVRLAWSIQAGRPVEQPRVVAARYAGG